MQSYTQRCYTGSFIRKFYPPHCCYSLLFFTVIILGGGFSKIIIIQKYISTTTLGNRKLEESHLNKHKKKNEQRVDLSVFRLGYNVMNGIRAYWKPFYHLLPFLGWLVASIFSLRLFLGVYDSFQSHNVFCDIHSTSYIILFSHILHPKDFPKV